MSNTGQKKPMNLRRFINLQSFVTLIALIVGVGAWLYTMNSVPSRVTTLEARVDVIEKSIVKNETQMELALNAIYEIRAALLNKK